MQGQRIGYIRVSSFDQNPERQLEHVEVGRVFTDKASGKDTQRPECDLLLAFVREDDTVVVYSMGRLACNLDDLRCLVQKLTKRGVRIEFVKESLTFTGEDRLDVLLNRRDNGKTTWLDWLRQSPAKPNSRHMLEHIERLKAWQSLDLPPASSGWFTRTVCSRSPVKLAR